MPRDGSGDWFLQEWADFLGKRQADLVKELGWLKNAAHRIWHGKQPYRRETVNEIAEWLGIKPYELLMTPKEAVALRRLRETAAQIVAEGETPPFRGAPTKKTPQKAKRTGTRG
jgi:transcriptional regulator with XRE-family HTH domain